MFGQSVTFTATVSPQIAGTPTGVVTFQDSGTSIGTGSLSAGNPDMATFTASSPVINGVGTHTITAVYAGDTNFSDSTSANFPQTVNQASTTTTVTNAVNPSVFGQSVTFTATVAAFGLGAGTPGGTVHFMDSVGDDLGTATLSGGKATASLASTTVLGSHIITATYSGDNNFLTSTSANFTQTVNQASTTTTVTNAVNPSVFGQGVTFTATVTAGSGTFDNGGTVTFSDGSTSLGTAGLSGGQATFTALSSVITTVATHTITASYSGDTNFTTSSGSVLQTVNPASTTTTVTASPNASMFGQSVTFTATVSAAGAGIGTPTGVVTFKDGGSAIGTGSLSGSTPDTATFTTSTLAVSSSHAITAVYHGDNNFTTSTSATTVTQTVNQASTTTTISSSSSNPSVFGQSVTFTATVAAAGPGAGTPTGLVTFEDAGTAIGTGSLSGGTTDAATFTTSTLAVSPTHAITAVYNGDSNFITSASTNTVPQTVNQASTSTTISSSSNPSVFGQSVMFTATVAAVGPGLGTPGGTVHFMDSVGGDLGTATLSGGKATASLASTTVLGSHIITATYSGNGNFLTSTSANFTQTVNQASTTTMVTNAVNASVYGQGVTFTATVTAGSGTFDNGGTVTFSDGSRRRWVRPASAAVMPPARRRRCTARWPRTRSRPATAATQTSRPAAAAWCRQSTRRARRRR